MNITKGTLFPFLISLLIVSCQKENIVENKVPVVHAGTDTLVDLGNSDEDFITLSGSASDPDGSIVAYLWSQKSGPNTAEIENPGSSTTKVTNLVSGIYSFQLMATDDKGATGVKTVSITIKQPEEILVTLQPSNSPFDMHLLLLGSTMDQSDNTAPEIGGSAWTNNGVSFTMRGLLKFDLSALPANAKITSAKLTLYSNPTPLNSNKVDANYGSDNTLLLQRVTTNWNNSVMWQTQPATTSSNQIIIPHTSQSLLDIANLDVTNLIRDMQQYGNYGFSLRLQNEVIYTARIFCSSKYPDTSKHPKLVLQYTK